MKTITLETPEDATALESRVFFTVTLVEQLDRKRSTFRMDSLDGFIRGRKEFQTTTDRNMTVAPLTVGSALPFAPQWRSSWSSSEPISSGTIVLNTDS